MKEIGIAVIGCGVVGGGVCDELRRRRKHLSHIAGINLELKHVGVKNIRKKRSSTIPRSFLTTNIQKILRDPDVQIVVELIGGTTQARTLIRKAIMAGKHVVTANKALLAEHGKEIFKCATGNKVIVNLEASVCGGVPIVKTLSDGLSANHISQMLAIVNGTSNFILTKMSMSGSSFNEALREAQQLGFAEANPSLDVSGKDAAHKLAILSMLSFGYLPKPREIYTEGIAKIQNCDIVYAGDMGCVIKHLAIAKRIGNELELRVHPTLIPKNHVLASVNGEYNAAFITSDLLGDSLLYGKGAGRYPTTSAVIADIVDIARGLAASGLTCGDQGTVFRHQDFLRKRLKVRKIEKALSTYYIRITALDKPGVLTKVSGLLSKNGISIASVSQKISRASGIVPVVMMTHTAEESAVTKSIAAINRLTEIKGKTVVIRMENADAT